MQLRRKSDGTMFPYSKQLLDYKGPDFFEIIQDDIMPKDPEPKFKVNAGPKIEDSSAHVYTEELNPVVPPKVEKTKRKAKIKMEAKFV